MLAAARRPSHAYLFTGPAPEAKRAAAIAFAAALLCEAPRPDGDACGACVTCRAVAGPGHPDLRLWDVPEGEKTFKVDHVRELISAVGRKPFSRPRQVHVLGNLDAVNPAGANALLKTLEEPPPTTTLVLLASDLEGVLPTIVSRCQLVSFGAEAAQGGTAEAPPLPPPGGALAWTDALAGKPAEELVARLEALVRWLADVALVAACAEAGQAPPLHQLRHPERLAEAQGLADAASVATWLARVEAVEAAREALGRHGNARLVLDRLARRLAG